jgi:hypothetical protein
MLKRSAVRSVAFLVSASVGAGSPPGRPSGCALLPRTNAPAAVTNDNRSPAGTLVGDTLVVRLVVTPVTRYPEGRASCGVPVLAFAEEGKAASVPGPLLRVRSGAAIRATVRNAGPTTVWLRGLQDHLPPFNDTVAVAPGATRELRFRATVVGAFLYTGRTILGRNRYFDGDERGGQLVGALVVDSSGVPRAVAGSRALRLYADMAPQTSGARPRFAFVLQEGDRAPAADSLVLPGSPLVLTQGEPTRITVVNRLDRPLSVHWHGLELESYYDGVSGWSGTTGHLAPAERTIVARLNSRELPQAAVASRPGPELTLRRCVHAINALATIRRCTAADPVRVIERLVGSGHRWIRSAGPAWADHGGLRHQRLPLHERGVAAGVAPARPHARHAAPEFGGPDRQCDSPLAQHRGSRLDLHRAIVQRQSVRARPAVRSDQVLHHHSRRHRAR